MANNAPQSVQLNITVIAIGLIARIVPSFNSGENILFYLFRPHYSPSKPQKKK